jgi:hypothetical protein
MINSHYFAWSGFRRQNRLRTCQQSRLLATRSLSMTRVKEECRRPETARILLTALTLVDDSLTWSLVSSLILTTIQISHTHQCLLKFHFDLE